MAFVAWMIIDCLRNQENYFWLYLIFFLQPFGAIIYFVTHKLADFEVGRRFTMLWSGQGRLSQLKAQVYQLDRAYHWEKLGEEYLARRNWGEAARCFEEALKREAQLEEAHYGLGRTRLAQGRWQEALDEIVPLVEKEPVYDHGAGLLAIARALRGLGRTADSIEYYRFLLQHYTYSEARYEYAELLYASGQRPEALDLMRTILQDGRNTTGFNRRQERRWGRRAGRFLRQHAPAGEARVSL